jgi:hypothetical protein
MAVLFRGMKDDGDGTPLCEPSGRALGVRLEGDIPIRADGTVEPETGGMSVAIDVAGNLPPHRRPEEFRGWGPDPVWQIDEDDLPERLAFRRDPKDPSRHGFVEPTEVMELSEYQEILATSRGFWVRA